MPRSLGFRSLLAGLVAIGAFAGCDAILGIDNGTPRDGGDDAATGSDAGNGGDATFDAPDEAAATCDVDAAFGTPVLLAALDTASNDAHLRLTGDELAGYFHSNRDGGAGSYDIYSATRAALDAGWKVTNVSTINSFASETEPSIDDANLVLYLVYGSDIYRATRASTSAAFSVPTAVVALDSPAAESGPHVLPNGNVYFTSTRAVDGGPFELYTAAASDGGFATPTLVTGSDLGSAEVRFGAVTPDELVLYFASTRTGNLGGRDIYVATRATTTAPFGPSTLVKELSSAASEYPDWISPDRCRLYFTSNRADAGDDNVYVAEKPLP